MENPLGIPYVDFFTIANDFECCLKFSNKFLYENVTNIDVQQWNIRVCSTVALEGM